MARPGRRRTARTPTALSDLLVPARPGTEIPDESEISTTGWDEEELGVEAWAWYRSFHWQPTDRWGIYLTDEGIWRLADRLRGAGGSLGPIGTVDLLALATDVLLWHEYFHFLTDLASAAAELANLLQPPGPLYVPHAQAVLAAPPHTGRPKEEALANAYALQQIRPTRIRPALKKVFQAQPFGYRDFSGYLGANFVHGCRGLLREITLHAARNVSGEAPLELMFDTRRTHYGFTDVPVRLVQKLRGTAYELGFVESIARHSLVEARTFEKDLRRLPKPVLRKLDQALDKLADTRSPGLAFKRLTNCGSTWSIRVGGDHRLALRHEPPVWVLLRLLPRGDIYKEVCS